MPSARTTIFGSALKSRFAVNGIQYSALEPVTAGVAACKTESLCPMMLLLCSRYNCKRNRGCHGRNARMTRFAVAAVLPLRSRCRSTQCRQSHWHWQYLCADFCSRIFQKVISARASDARVISMDTFDYVIVGGGTAGC